MKTLKIKDICDKGSSSLKQKDVENQNGKYPVFGASGLIGKIDTYHQNKEYIAIVKDGSGIGRVSFMPAFSSVIGTLQYILPRKGFNIKYVSYCLQSLDLAKFKQGAAIPHIYFKDYGEHIVNVEENAKEQQRIVSYLDAQFAKIDQLKENAERQLQAAKDLWQKALNEMLEPKDLWDRKELKDLCTHIIDCPHTTPKKSENKTNFPCIRTSELKNGSIYWESMQYLEESEYLKRISRLIPQADDIVYGREGTFGDAVLLPQGYKFCLGQRTMLLRPNKDIISPNFLHYAIISPLVYNQAQEKNSGCGVPHVNVADVKKFKISFPKSLCEQKKITTQLDELSLRCKLLESNYNTTITLCNDLKQSLLKQIFE